MIACDAEIKTARERGDIVIEPFNSLNLGSDTYDVTLGEFYFRESIPNDGDRLAFDPFDKVSIFKVWGLPQRAIKWSGFDERIIWIEPGETLLAHTQEFIGGLRRYTTKMFARSSIGRSMLGVCKCAGRGDVGYINRWTLEITSFSRYHSIPLRVGSRVAQIEFQEVRQGDKFYGQGKSKYQDGGDVLHLMNTWHPEMMLPKLYLDREITK